MDRRAKTDLKPLPFSAGENSDVDFIDYDRVRKILPIRETRSCFIGARTLSTEMTCPICLELLSQTMTAKECLHRFCSECITMALQRGNKECPTCRKKLVSKRSLRPDPNFDLLISKVWPDRSLYDTLQLAENSASSSENNGTGSNEESVKEQEDLKRKRAVDESDTLSKKPKTEDDDFDDFNGEGTSDRAMADLDLHDSLADNGPRVDFDTTEDDQVFEGEIDLEFQNIEEMDNNHVAGEEVSGGYMHMAGPPQEDEYPGEWDGYDEYDPYEDMNGLTTEQQEELQADLEELENLEYDDYESDFSDEEDGDECCDDEEDIEDLTADDPVDVESPPMNEGDDILLAEESPDSAETDANGDSNNADNLNADDTNTEATASACSPPESQSINEDAPAPTVNGTDNGLSHGPRQASVITSIPEFNPNFEEKFESISPPEVENGDTVDTEGQEEGQDGSGSDSTTTTYSSSGCTSSTSEESSSISIIFSDDDEEIQLSTIFPTELPMLELDTQRPVGSGIMHGLTPSSMAGHSSSTMHGQSSSMLAAPSSTVMTTPSSSMMAGHPSPTLMSLPPPSIMMPPPPMVAGSLSSMMPGQPPSIMTSSVSSMMPPVTSSMMAPPATSMFAALSLPMIPVSSMMSGPSSMQGPSSSMIAGPSSLLHGPSSTLSGNSGSIIKLPPTSLSALAEELPPFRDPDAIERVPEGTGDEIRPPSNSIPPKDRLNHWLANSPSSPQSPVEDMATMPERRSDDVDMMEPAISGSEEMEAELLPALSLSSRDCPEELLIPRYVRAKHDTKMEHLAEFIHQRAMEEAQSNQTDFDADPVPTIPKPKHFYVFSRNGGHHVKQIFLHETMTTASCAMTHGDHLIIFFDTASIELRGDRQSILTDVVSPHFLSLPTV